MRRLLASVAESVISVYSLSDSHAWSVIVPGSSDTGRRSKIIDLPSTNEDYSVDIHAIGADPAVISAVAFTGAHQTAPAQTNHSHPREHAYAWSGGPGYGGTLQITPPMPPLQADYYGTDVASVTLNFANLHHHVAGLMNIAIDVIGLDEPIPADLGFQVELPGGRSVSLASYMPPYGADIGFTATGTDVAEWFEHVGPTMSLKVTPQNLPAGSYWTFHNIQLETGIPFVSLVGSRDGSEDPPEGDSSGTTPVEFDVRAWGPMLDGLSVPWQLDPSSQATAADFLSGSSTSGNVAFASVAIGDPDHGWRDEVKTITMDVKDDDEVEPRKQVLARLQNKNVFILQGAPVQAAELKDNDVSFKQARFDFHGQGVRRDTDEQTLYESPQWLDANWNQKHDDGNAGKGYPISYVRTIDVAVPNTLKITPKFFVEAQDPNALQGWRVIGDDLGIVGGPEFTSELAAPEPGAAVWLTVAEAIESQAPLGDQIWHGELKINWRLERVAPGQADPGAPVLQTVDYGQTSNYLYITGAPTFHEDLKFETVQRLSTRPIGLRPGDALRQLALVDAIFDEFVGLDVRRSDDHKLTYWAGGGNTPTSPEDNPTVGVLLSAGDGRCQDWCLLLSASSALAGVELLRTAEVVISRPLGDYPAIPPGNVHVADVIQWRAIPAQGGAVPPLPNATDNHAMMYINHHDIGLHLWDPSLGLRNFGGQTLEHKKAWWEDKSVERLMRLSRDLNNNLFANPFNPPRRADGQNTAIFLR